MPFRRDFFFVYSLTFSFPFFPFLLIPTNSRLNAVFEPSFGFCCPLDTPFLPCVCLEREKRQKRTMCQDHCQASLLTLCPPLLLEILARKAKRSSSPLHPRPEGCCRRLSLSRTRRPPTRKSSLCTTPRRFPSTSTTETRPWLQSPAATSGFLTPPKPPAVQMADTASWITTLSLPHILCG